MSDLPRELQAAIQDYKVRRALPKSTEPDPATERMVDRSHPPTQGELMAEARTPRYCGYDGSRLIPDNTYSGFDPFTGDPLETQRLVCRNPTVEIVNLRKQILEHPAWRRTGDTWVVD